MLSFKNILVPMDFSTPAKQALKLAEGMASDPGATLHVCHVAPAATVTAGDVVTGLAAGNQREAVSKELADLPVMPGLNVKRHLVEGDAGKEIVRLAMEHRADLIVIGTHGRTGLSRLLLGSVAEYVLRHAPCPVLAWRQPECK